MNYDNIYVASFNKNEIFSLKDFTFQPKEHDFPPGQVVKLEDGVFQEHQLTEQERDTFTQNKVLADILNKTIIDNNEGKIVYDVAWWAGDFNNFMYGFCDRHFEV